MSQSWRRKVLDEAIARMTLIARHHPNTTWGDEAQYFVPYLHLLHGDWKTAASGFDEYAQKYPTGVERREARSARSSETDRASAAPSHSVKVGADDHLVLQSCSHLGP